MIKIENERVCGFEDAVRGMRNPLNSWEKSDSEVGLDNIFIFGNNDFDLAKRLAAQGPVHAKYRRMINVYLDVTAPLYWWKEFDTYKVGTVANSCSTMHTLHKEKLKVEDFSCESLVSINDIPDWRTRKHEDMPVVVVGDDHLLSPRGTLMLVVKLLNQLRDLYLKTGDKQYWEQMIQLLPSSYNQKRTIMLNYEVLANIYYQRRNHKLKEWRDFCAWVRELPYSYLITQGL